MTKIIDEWYKVEYSFCESGSTSLVYVGSKEINSRKGAEQFASLIVHLAETDEVYYTNKQKKWSDKIVGKGKTIIGIKHFYKYIKLEIKIKERKDDLL